MLVSLLVIGGLVGFLNFESRNAQGTNVSGPITIDTIWDLAGSPYIVVGDITVLNGITLTIEPGVRVLFDGYYSIYVNGNLTAIGMETNRIIISSNLGMPAPLDWRNIQINSNGHAEIKYCDITYARDGIYLEDTSNNNITNNNMLFNVYGILLYPSSNNTITNNSLSRNNEGFRVRESSNNVISYNKISDNEVGIFLWDSSNITMTNNNFVNDGVFIHGYVLQHFNSHTIPDDNMVNGEPLYYYRDSSDINIDNIPVGQLILANCTDIDIKNLEINKTVCAVEVAYSTNILIANNNISSTNWGGIELISSSNNTVINNHIVNGDWGMEIRESSNNNIIANNNVSSHNDIGIGIGIGSSFNNIISNNNISNSSIGVYIGTAWMDNSSNNIVTGNNFSDNERSIFVFWASDNEITENNISNYNWGISFHSSSNNKIIGNNIIGNSISNSEFGLSFIESSNSNVITGNTISKNNNGSYLEDSSNNIFANNNISNNGKGIILQPSVNNNVITGNTISWNDYMGIYLRQSPNNNITGNDISDNLEGINISYLPSKNNIVRGNTVSNNSYGISLWVAPNNSIYNNNLINNTIQAVDNTNNENQWDNGYPSGGNYWSDFDESSEGAYDDYEGPNQDVPGSDDIVDNGTGGGGGKNPYEIDADSQDNYPLINLSQGVFLYEGWNLISIPFIQSDTNLEMVLSPITGSYDSLWLYNVSDSFDPWKHYHTSKPSYMNDLDDINHTMGFWIYITEPGGVIFDYSGTPPTENQTITLNPGWNLVGYPSKSDKLRDNALGDLVFGDDIYKIKWYNAPLGRMEEVTGTDYLKIGFGYWVYANNFCVWDVPL